MLALLPDCCQGCLFHWSQGSRYQWKSPSQKVNNDYTPPRLHLTGGGGGGEGRREKGGEVGRRRENEGMKKEGEGEGEKEGEGTPAPHTHHVWCQSKPNSHPSFSLSFHDKVEKLIILFVCVDSQEGGAFRSLASLREGGRETKCGVVDL